MLQYQWFYKNRGNEEKVDALAKSLNIPQPNARLLIQRGIETFDQAKDYFRPQLSHLHDPFLMKDMDLAIQRLSQAIFQKEKVLIYGDYDVDGTTAVALVYSFLKRFTQHIDYYIPNRYTEGYGISFQSIDYAFENDCKLIIALDCGIKAVDKVKYAKEKGIDYIICDHHLPGDVLPEAVAILNPKQSDCHYPNEHLSGCGVGFKLVQAFAKENHIDKEETYPLLDLVTVSIASDIVPIVGENRVMAYYGLKLLNGNPSVGLQSLIQIADIKNSEMDISDIVFRIGPRINAAGRLKSGKYAVELLIEQDYAKAENYAKAINQINSERKDLDHNITTEALQMIDNSEELMAKKTTVLFHKNWHKGVVGIVASRLMEHYYRPTIIFSQSDDGILTGSARSVMGFNVHQAIEACSEYLLNYGGHMYAAGLSLKKEHFQVFADAFENVVNRTITKDLLVPKIEIDLDINLEDIDRKFFNIVRQMAPFGPGNMRPVFSMQKIKDNGTSRAVGRDKSHLKLTVCKDDNRNAINGIAFGMAHHYPQISKHPFSVCFSLFQNEFNGKTSIEMDVKDLQVTPLLS